MIRVIGHGDVTELLCSTWRSRLAGFAVSAYVIRGVLVDTAFPQVGPALERWLDTQTVRGVVVTHAHEDHAGNVERMARRGVPLWLAPLTRERLTRPPAIRPYRRFTWGAPPPLLSVVRPFEPDDLEIILTPGHSPDHHVVFDPPTRTLVGGDLFLGVRVRVAHPAEDPRRQVETLRRIAARDPVRLFDAHRGLVRGAAQALRAKADWVEEMVTSIERLVREGWTDRRIRDRVLGREGVVGYASGGEYSKLNFVRAVRRQAERA